MENVWPELFTMTGPYGCFNRRRISGGSGWSLHAEGRAFDTGVLESQREMGWLLACDLVRHRAALGVMRVMWDRHIWSTEQAAEWRRLAQRTHQHTDHVHTEQFWAHARRAYHEVYPQYRRTLETARAAW